MAGCVGRLVLVGVAVALAGPGLAWGQDNAAVEPTRIGFPQYPSISPDGSLVVFSWAGDLWSVDATGGVATRLTSHPADERRSAFSPDGRWLAFESDRDGVRNLYRMPLTRTDSGVAAGPIERITVSDRSQTLGSFSADGSEVFFSGSHELAIYRHARPYRVPAAGGPVTRLSDAFATTPHAGPDGRTVIVTRGRYDFNRPAYNGSGAMDVYSIDLPTGVFTRLTSLDNNDGDGFALPDGSVVFVSARDGQNNLFRLDSGASDRGRVRPAGLNQLTRFKPDDGQATIGHGVRDLRVAWSGRVAVFGVYDQLYTLRLDRPGARPEPIDLVASGDAAALDHQRKTLDRLISEAALSPDGKTLAVIARGEVFVRPTDDGRPTQRVTHTDGRERGLAWSPDGRDLYFASDESGDWDLCRARVTLTRSDLSPDEPKTDTTDEAAAPAEPAQAAPDDGVSGEWVCQASGGDIEQGSHEVSISLSLEGDQLSGQIVVPGLYEGPLEGTYNKQAHTATLTADVSGQLVTLVLTIERGELAGTATLAETTYDLVGERIGVAGGAAGEDEADEQQADDADKDDADKDDADDVGDRWAGALRFEIVPIVTGPTNDRVPMPSPDGRWLLFVRGLGDLVLMDLASGQTRTVLQGWDEPEVVWAGDSRQIVFARQDLDFNSDIWLLDVLDTDAEPFNITRHPDYDYQPRLSADGKVLVFLSDRAGENWDFDVWGVYLDKRLEHLPAYELKEHFKEAAGAMKKRSPIDPPAEPAGDAGDEDDSPDAPEDDASELPELQAMDVHDAYKRVRRLSSFPGGEDDLAITPGGDRVVFTGSVNGSAGLYSINYAGKERKTVAGGSASDVRVTLKGGTASYVSGGQARSAGVAGGSTKTYPVRARIVLDIPAQQQQKFIEAARILGTRFYHPTLKGLDWPTLTARYLVLARATRTAAGFNRVVSMLFGELDGSHLGIYGGDAFSAPGPAVGELGTITRPVPGGYEIVRVLAESPAQAVGLESGDVITAVGDRELAESDDAMPSVELAAAMAGLANVESLIEVRSAPDDDQSEPTTRLVLITPISGGAMRNLLYDDEVERRRQLVDELSNGTIGYLHIQGMNEPSVREFERDLYAAAYDRAGLIIDVRDNGGGWTTDILLSSLTAPVHAYTVPRGARRADALPNAYPRDRRLIYAYQRPLSVLINENSFSNAEIFAHAIHTIGRGKLVGTATFGGVISTGSTTLIDGTRVRTPFRGWYLPDGTDMEEHGAQPDLPVGQTPADEIAQRDAQLRAAVEELMARVAESPDGLWHPGQE